MQAELSFPAYNDVADVKATRYPSRRRLLESQAQPNVSTDDTGAATIGVIVVNDLSKTSQSPSFAFRLGDVVSAP